VGKFIYVAGLVALGYGAFHFDGLWRIVLIIVAFSWLLIGWVIVHSNNLVEKAPVRMDAAVVRSKFTEKSVSGAAGIVSTNHAYAIVFEFLDGSRKKYLLMRNNMPSLWKMMSGCWNTRRLVTASFL